MAKRIVFTLLMAIMLVACSSKPTTQQECLDKGLFKYKSECVEWNEIPDYDHYEVIDEVAEEIAEANGVSKEEALIWMGEVINQVVGE